MRFKPGWVPKNAKATNLANEEDWKYLLEQIHSHLLKELAKKQNSGIVPPWSIDIYDGQEQVKGNSKKGGKGNSQVSTSHVLALDTNLHNRTAISQRETFSG
jgi:hypothetical protein